MRHNGFPLLKLVAFLLLLDRTMRGRISGNTSLWCRVSFISIEDLRMHVHLRSGETIAHSFATEDQLSDYLKDLLEVESLQENVPHLDPGRQPFVVQPHTSF